MKTIIRPTLLILSTSLLAACAMLGGDKLPVAQRPINVKADSGFNKSALLGFQAITFRTYNDDGEFKDAYCEVTGNGFVSNFLTPAIVMIPNFGATSGDMAVYCRFKDQPITNVIRIKKSRKINLTPLSAGIATAVGGPLAGTAVGALTDLVTPEQSSNYGYDDVISIKFK